MNLDDPIESLHLERLRNVGPRLCRFLASLDIRTIREATWLTDAEVLMGKNLGANSWRALVKALRPFELSKDRSTYIFSWEVESFIRQRRLELAGRDITFSASLGGLRQLEAAQ